MKIFCKKRGFSIVEVVIAMAVITIVSFTAVSLLSSASNHISKTRLDMYAVNDVANIWECFNVSANEEEFEQALNFAGFSFEQAEGKTTYKIGSSGGYIFYVDLDVVFGEGSDRSFFARAVNSETNKLLYEYRGV